MNRKNKTAVIRARCEPELQEQFERICKRLIRKPSEQLRQLVKNFVKRNK